MGANVGAGMTVGSLVGLHASTGFADGFDIGVYEACTVTLPSSSNFPSISFLKSNIDFAATDVLHSTATTNGRNTFISKFQSRWIWLDSAFHGRIEVKQNVVQSRVKRCCDENGTIRIALQCIWILDTLHHHSS